MGRKEAEKWSDWDTQRLIDLAKGGHTSAEICSKMGRTYGAIATKATRIQLQMRGGTTPADFDVAAQRDRPCMSCRSPMISTWIGHRICDECKDNVEWRYA